MINPFVAAGEEHARSTRLTLASIADDLSPGDSVVCMGIGSGLNAGVLELQW